MFIILIWTIIEGNIRVIIFWIRLNRHIRIYSFDRRCFWIDWITSFSFLGILNFVRVIEFAGFIIMILNFIYRPYVELILEFNLYCVINKFFLTGVAFDLEGDNLLIINFKIICKSLFSIVLFSHLLMLLDFSTLTFFNKLRMSSFWIS
jgi:hypothetical protein